jgi:hypothetical protein
MEQDIVDWVAGRYIPYGGLLELALHHGYRRHAVNLVMYLTGTMHLSSMVGCESRY